MKKVKALKRKAKVATKLETFLKEARLKAEVTQLGLAEFLGLTPQQVCNIEGFQTTWPPIHFRKVAKKLNIELDQMIKLRKQDMCEALDRYFVKVK